MVVSFGDAKVGRKFGRGLNKTGTLGSGGRTLLQQSGQFKDDDEINKFVDFSKQQGSGLNRKNLQSKFDAFRAQGTQSPQGGGNPTVNIGGQEVQTGGGFPGSGGGFPAPTAGGQANPANSSVVGQNPTNSNQTPQQTNIQSFGKQAQETGQVGATQTGQGIQQTQAGQQGIKDAIGNIGLVQDNFGQALAALQNNNFSNRAGNLAFDSLARAMQANVSPERLAQIAGRQGDRDQLIDFEFSDQGKTGAALKGIAQDVDNQFADRGLISSGRAGARQGELQAEREALAAQAKLGSLTQAQNEILGEQDRLTQAGIQSGNIASGLVGTAGNVENQLRNLALQGGQAQGDLANQAAQIGLGQQNIGAGNIQTSLAGQNNAINQFFNSLGLEAQLRQAEKLLQEQLKQQALNNVETDKQNDFNNEILTDFILPQLRGNTDSGGGFLGIF